MPEPMIMATFELDIYPRKLLAALEPRPVLDEAGNRKVSQLVRSLRRGGEPVAGLPPVTRHGASGFAGKFTYEILGLASDLTLRYGNSSRYARMLYYGGPIVPREAKALTIPIHPKAVGRRAKDFDDTFCAKSREGNMIIFQKVKKGRGKKRVEEIIPLFVLKSRVTLNPHPYPLPWTDADMAAFYNSLIRRLGAIGRAV